MWVKCGEEKEKMYKYIWVYLDLTMLVERSELYSEHIGIIWPLTSESNFYWYILSISQLNRTSLGTLSDSIVPANSPRCFFFVPRNLQIPSPMAKSVFGLAGGEFGRHQFTKGSSMLILIASHCRQPLATTSKD